MSIIQYIRQVWSALSGPVSALKVRFDKSPIDSPDSLSEFVRTRAAYISQTSLYGYLKARMGTQYRVYFEDETFSAVIRAAALKLFVSCTGDLSVFAVATAGRDGRLQASEMTALARHCFATALERTLSDEDRRLLPPELVAAFERRTESTYWSNAAVGENAFSGSGADLVRYAPVIDEFKALDEEIIRNSIRFRWRDVREQFRRRVSPEALCRRWRARAARPTPGKEQ